jgi:hypothetical protein
MKKIFITLSIALAASISAFAQNDGNNYWFVGIGGGMNFTHDGQKYENRENSHHGAGTALDVYVGKWFNDFAGFRAGYQGLGTSNKYIDYGRNRFDYGHVDVLFGVRDWFIPYIHAGVLNIDKVGAAGGVGIMAPIRIAKRIAIVPDLKAMAHTNRLFDGGRRSMAYTLTGTVGLAINIARPKPIVERVEVPKEVIRYKTDTVVVEKVRIDTVYVQRDIDDINKILSDVVLFDFDSYKLTDEAAAKYLGTDGTQVGMYGGASPFSPIPNYPRIKKFNVASQPTADGKLDVEIQVSTYESEDTDDSQQTTNP